MSAKSIPDNDRSKLLKPKARAGRKGAHGSNHSPAQSIIANLSNFATPQPNTSVKRLNSPPGLESEELPKDDIDDIPAASPELPSDPDSSTSIVFNKYSDVKTNRSDLVRQVSLKNEQRKKLPIWKHQSDIRKSLRASDVLLLVGETGSGKSTQVPQFLLDESWCKPKRVKIKSGQGRIREVIVGGQIAITEPRRVAATSLAQRVANETGSYMGDNVKLASEDDVVGYSVRFQQFQPPGMRMKYLTEGMLLQELLHDPYLTKYSCVIIDEIHERSVDVDLVAGFVKNIVCGDLEGRGGVPLKVVVMSATANMEGFRKFFSGDPMENENALEDDISSSHDKKVKVGTLHITGSTFDVDIIHTPAPVQDYTVAMHKTIFQIHVKEPLPGDILAFLTGQDEIEDLKKRIEETARQLNKSLPRVQVVPLYGQLSFAQQQMAFQRVKQNTRKVILATNIAETSITVPGVRFVVDCGKAKIKKYRPKLGLHSLLVSPISQSSAIQRRGRAGREAVGKCYRLYTETDFLKLEKAESPEILRSNVTDAVFKMKSRGVDDVLTFPMMDRPSSESLRRALTELHVIGAINHSSQMSPMGNQMSKFPLSTSYSRTLIEAAKSDHDCILDVIDAISCISPEEEIFIQAKQDETFEELAERRRDLIRREGDILTYMTAMQRFAAETENRGKWCKERSLNVENLKRAYQVRHQLRTMCLKMKLVDEVPPDPQPFEPASSERAEIILKCFMAGFALNTAVLHRDGSYKTTRGKEVVAIHPSSSLHRRKVEAIIFMEHVFTNRNYAKKVSVLQLVWIAEALESSLA